VEPLFDMGVQREPGGKSPRARGSDQALLVVDDIEWDAGMDFGGIGQIVTFDNGEQAVREKSVGSVPRVGTGFLRAELRVIDVEVQYLVTARVLADIRCGHHVAVPKSAAPTDLKSIVVILSRIGELEIGIRGGGAGEILDKAVDTTLPDVFHFQINFAREFAFERQAFVEYPGCPQGMRIGSKRGEYGAYG